MCRCLYFKWSKPPKWNGNVPLTGSKVQFIMFVKYTKRLHVANNIRTLHDAGWTFTEGNFKVHIMAAQAGIKNVFPLDLVHLFE